MHAAKQATQPGLKPRLQQAASPSQAAPAKMAPRRSLRAALASLLAALLTLAAWPAMAWDMAGTRQVLLHGRDGTALPIAKVVFTPQADGRTGFVLTTQTERFKDFFLSMKEFKCVEGGTEILCHVPYPYPQPGTVSATDLAWLEHSLLFMFKTPSEFGAKLWNGIYFKLHLTDLGLEGRPQAIDLNAISAPPARPGVPPYRAALRDDIAPGARWFNRLTIE